MTTHAEARHLVAEMLVAEQGCRPEDFSADAVRIFRLPRPRAGDPLVRHYPRPTPAFTAVTMGVGAVVAASRSILSEIERIFGGAQRDHVFEPARLAAVAGVVAAHGLTVRGPYPRLLSTADTWRARPVPGGYTVTIEPHPASARIEALDPSRWPNAVSRRRQVQEQAIAVAWHGEDVVGLASCSADTARLWQIGIDVAERHRGRGLGAALTSALARFILDQGAIPWYGVAPANVASLNTAVAAGFRFGWVEVYSYPLSR